MLTEKDRIQVLQEKQEIKLVNQKPASQFLILHL